MLRRCYIESDYIKREKVGRPGGGERERKILFLFICMCIYLCMFAMCICRYPRRLEEGLKFSGARVIGNHETVY